MRGVRDEDAAAAGRAYNSLGGREGDVDAGADDRDPGFFGLEGLGGRRARECVWNSRAVYVEDRRRCGRGGAVDVHVRAGSSCCQEQNSE